MSTSCACRITSNRHRVLRLLPVLSAASQPATPRLTPYAATLTDGMRGAMQGGGLGVPGSGADPQPMSSMARVSRASQLDAILGNGAHAAVLANAYQELRKHGVDVGLLMQHGRAALKKARPPMLSAAREAAGMFLQAGGV